MNGRANLLVTNAPPFDNRVLRRAMQLTLDRKSFIDILGEGQYDIGAVLQPPPEGIWGMPPEMLQQLTGYGPDVVVPLNYRDMAATYPDLFPTGEAARKALERENPGQTPIEKYIIGVCPGFCALGYRRVGSRGPASKLLFDRKRI